MWKKSRSPPWQGKDWKMMKVFFSTLTRPELSQNRVRGKRRFGWRRQSTPEKFKTFLTKGKVSCSFPWIKVKMLSICLWSVFLWWTIGVCSVGGQVSISFLVLVLSVVDISLLKWPLGVRHLFFWGPSFPGWPFLFNLLHNTSLQDWLFVCFNFNELHTFFLLNQFLVRHWLKYENVATLILRGA